MAAWVANGGLRYGALVAQEAKESLHHAEPGSDGPWGELVVKRGLDPGINSGGCGLCEVLIEDGLPRRWHQDGEAFQGADRPFLDRRGRVAGAQISQIVSNASLIRRAEQRPPPEPRELLGRWGRL